MSRRASLFAKDKSKSRPKVRFPDELVFLDNLKENDVQAMASMLRRVSVQLDINAIGDTGMAPLHAAVVDGNLAAVKLLVRNGADVNKEDEDTWTPLHAACANGHPDIIKFLLENGSDKNTRNEDNERPYDLIDPQDFECVSVMLSHNQGSSSQDDYDSGQSEHEDRSESEPEVEEEEEEDEEEDPTSLKKWMGKLRGSYETLLEEKSTDNTLQTDEHSSERTEEETDEGQGGEEEVEGEKEGVQA